MCALVKPIFGECENGYHIPENTGVNNSFIHQGYYSSDINLDGKVIYQGIDNEPNLIFFNVLSNTGNSTISNNYIIQEQLPK